MDTIAKRLKHARGNKSQGTLAAEAGVSQSTIGNIEAGIRQARGSLPQIAEALGVTLKWLRDGEGPMRAEHHALPDAPSPSEWAHLLEYRDLAKAQRAEIDALTSARAEMMRALRHEMEERMGRTPAARPDTSNSPSEDVPLPPPQDDLTKRIKDRPTRVKTRKSLGSRSKSLNHRKKGAG